MSHHISVPKLLSCYFDCCLALHFFFHNQSSIESLWNHCSWLQVGRQCNHSICTLQLSTTTHSASHNHPPHALQTALREVAEILRKILRKIVQNRFYCASEGCGHFAEILRKFAEMCGIFFRRKLVQQMLCRMRAAVRTHFPPDTASENGSWSF